MLALFGLEGVFLVMAIAMAILCLCAFLFFFIFFWIWMLVDCIRNQRMSGNQRLLWALVIFFLHTIGAVIYFFAARSGNRTAATT